MRAPAEPWRWRGLLIVPLLLVACSGPPAAAPEERAEADRSWVVATTGLDDAPRDDPLLVAILDGGIDPHPDLDGKIVGAWEAASVAGLARSGHGTQIAGILVADEIGLAPTVELLDVRVLDQHGNGTPSDVAAGIAWAVDNGADIVNASFAMERSAPELSAAVRMALDEDVVLIAATASSFTEVASYPAGYAGVIGVTAIDRDGERAPLASAASATVAAPGRNVMTIDAKGGLTTADGTSVAAAVATAVVASCFSAEVVAKQDVASALIAASAEDARFGEHRVPIITCRSSKGGKT